MPGQPAHIAMALSGGGFRATLFHLGVVRLLYETGQLKSVNRVSAVSGGSILAAHLALNWDKYNGEPADFDAAAIKLIKFIQSDVRGKVVRRWILAWLVLFPRILFPKSKRWTRGNLIQSFYSKLFDSARLQDLRGKGRPEIVINCTSLSNGAACSFGPSGFALYKRKENDVEINKRSDEISVAFAVAASSAFPPLFPPIEISNETLRCKQAEFSYTHCLTDGGVYDNLGIDRIEPHKGNKDSLEFLLISNAEGDFDSKFGKSYALSIARNIRASDILMARVSSLQFEHLSTRKIQFIEICIKNEIEYTDVSIFSIEKQRLLSQIRTDLDEFTSTEVTALIAHGYSMARYKLTQEGIISECTPIFSWNLLNNLEGLKSVNSTKELGMSSKRKLRLWSYTDWASLAATLIVIGSISLLWLASYNKYEANLQLAKAIAAQDTANLLANNLEELRRVQKNVVKDIDDQIYFNKDIASSSLKKEIHDYYFLTSGEASVYQVCQGEYQYRCPTGSDYVNCEATVDEWVQKRCKHSKKTRISSTSGNRCGYDVWQIICWNDIGEKSK